LREVGELSGAQADLVALIDEQACLLSNITTLSLVAARLDANEGISLRAAGGGR
jgi:hypothetical protein